MSFLLANGLIEVVVPVGQKICVTSYGAGTTKVEAEIGPNNYPIAFSLLKLITNSDYTSPVFTKDTIVKITAGLCDVEYIVGINPFPTISRVTTDNNGSFLLEDNTVIDGNLSVSGLLGLGVTPSAWTLSAAKAIQVGPWGSFSSNNSNAASTDVGHNIFGGYSYLQTQAASFYRQNQGQHQWFTAPSGTAGNPITFTQAMDLANTSGASTLTVNSATNTASAFRLATNGGLTAGIFLANPTVDHSLGFQTNNTERARITAGGNLLVGTTVDNEGRLQVAGSGGIRVNEDGSGTKVLNLRSNFAGLGPAVQVTTSDPLLFLTANTECARITSAGNQINFQPAESAQNTSATLTVSQLQRQIITANAEVTLTLPTGTALETYTTGMAVNTAFEVVFIATTANAITIDANGNTTVGSLTINGNTSGTFRFRKTAANTFTVYRTA